MTTPRPVLLTPHLWFDGTAASAVELYTQVFDARLEDLVRASPEGPVLHALVRIGGAPLMLADARPGGPEHGPRDGATAGVWLSTPDCDALFERATSAGFKPVYRPKDTFWGERIAKVEDPFGHPWSLATQVEDVGAQELQRRQREFLERQAATPGPPHDEGTS